MPAAQLQLTPLCILVQLGSSAGVTVVLDCGGADADVDPDLLKHLTIISPNESELANLTGVALPSTHGHKAELCVDYSFVNVMF